MKKFLILLLIGSLVLIGLGVILNIKVTTRQGVNYKWYSIRMPLYLKILDFFDRHYNYKELVKRIIKDTDSDEERVMKILEWAHNNIRKTPEGFPIVDDHVWYIIVRGYGASDQFSDVFTTLCNYAGLDAFYDILYNENRSKRISLSFVRFNGTWTVFDPYRSIYFRDQNGELMDILRINSSTSLKIESLDKNIEFDYGDYFNNISLVKPRGLNRANIQSPFNRFRFAMRKLLNKNNVKNFPSRFK